MVRRRPAPSHQRREQLDQPRPGDGVACDRLPDLDGIELSAADLCCSDHDSIGLGDDLRDHLRREGRSLEDLFRGRRWLDETARLKRSLRPIMEGHRPMPPLGWEFIDG